jgi:hypothetical protein
VSTVCRCRCCCRNSWKAAAQTYLQLGGRLLQQLQSSSGALLSEQALSQVADAREALEKADAAYNAALDKLEVTYLRLFLSDTCSSSRKDPQAVAG